MQFEYDLVKSETNKIKHGIDFNEAQKLWNDLMKAEELDKKFDEDEDILDYCDLTTAKRPGLETSNLTNSRISNRNQARS